MWKAAMLTFGLLAILVDRTRSNEDHPPYYGMKLCGREFIRAVIFTCGGSRWRRNGADSGGDATFDPWNTNSAPEPNSENQPSEYQVWKREPVDVGSSATGFSRFTRLPISLGRAEREGQDIVVGLSNACCKMGCSRGDISSLC